MEISGKIADCSRLVDENASYSFTTIHVKRLTYRSRRPFYVFMVIEGNGPENFFAWRIYKNIMWRSLYDLILRKIFINFFSKIFWRFWIKKKTHEKIFVRYHSLKDLNYNEISWRYSREFFLIYSLSIIFKRSSE